ncbi:MAG: LPS export ABC transporter periplasmic protein LptC [Pseudomonadota bacterium]
MAHGPTKFPPDAPVRQHPSQSTMTSRSTRRGLLLAAVLAAFTWWLADDDDGAGDGPIEGLDIRLDYALENFEMRAFDARGEQAMRLWAPRLTSEAATDVGQVDQPRLEVRHEGFLWHIIAETATISPDQEEVFLGGEVRLERSGATPAARVDIDGRDVTLLIEERVALSSAPVRLEDPSGTLNATGFRVNMLTEEFQLHENVKGVYDLPE